jgi:predicted  nucleic acid-binding Zn-ribbon protein|tara:strand:+ start:292 stop:702 length:411 start_codon:yes stop_codon:yes gene_type:complete
MIREDFLLRAVRIRKNYISLTNNLDVYLSKVENVSNKLEKTIDEITNIEKKYENSEKKNIKFESDKTLKELLKIIENVESEGKRLESIVNPLNKEIEKLSKEEVELYKLIKQTHSNLTEGQIVNSVKERLDSEGLI